MTLVRTNLAIFRQIAVDSYEGMQSAITKGSRSNPDSIEGLIIAFDPSRAGYKYSLVTIVFVTIWLEAYLHLLIAHELGVDKAEKFDRKSYEQKLEILSCPDKSVLEMAKRLRKARRELVHEKAHLDSGSTKIAQKEAKNAYELLISVERLLPLGRG